MPLSERRAILADRDGERYHGGTRHLPTLHSNHASNARPTSPEQAFTSKLRGTCSKKFIVFQTVDHSHEAPPQLIPPDAAAIESPCRKIDLP